jgi:hypothetical protein
LIAVATRLIDEKLPGSVMSDAEQVLLLFAGRYYTVEEVLRVDADLLKDLGLG